MTVATPSKPTGLVIDRRYLDHDTGPGHPERPDRIRVLLPFGESQEPAYQHVAARSASGDEIALVHDDAYVEEVEATQHHRFYAFDADTPTSQQSYGTACLAAGGFLALLDTVKAGEVDNGFALVRPPGHHAERHRAMGFCLFNNVAIGAEYLRRKHGLERVLIVDWDLHHGNGTQNMFESDPGVLYMSLHQYPYYPGTGAMDECGSGDGEGFTVNVPLPAGCGDAEYDEAFERVLLPIAHAYAPQAVLISAGFDAHARDPLGGMQVTEFGFRHQASALLDVAREHAQGFCAAILEGGYDLLAIESSTRAVLEEMRGMRPDTKTVFHPQRASRVSALVDRIRQVQQRYWRI